jgi:hypothetical protein
MEEQMVGQITQRMRETLSVDAVLQTAATQLRELMSLSGVEIRVGAAEFDTAAPSGADMGWYFDTDGASGGDGRVADEPQGTDGSIPRSPGA